MNIRKFAKDHKKEIVIGALVIAGVATAVYVVKTKKAPPAVPAKIPDEDFVKIAANLVKQWEENGCCQMTESSLLLSDFDRYAKWVQKCNPDALDKTIEIIIGFGPTNRRMSIRPATTSCINLNEVVPLA